MNKNNLVLPVSVLLASLILGGFYYASQVNKQRSIERQQQAELEQQKVELEQEKAVLEREWEAKEWGEFKYKECIEKAERDYQRYVELNGTINEKKGAISASTSVWDRAKKNKQQDVDNCFKQYKE